MDAKSLVELSHDIQSGLGRIDVPDFDNIRIIGMASILAMHIRGLGEIDYEVLRKVSEFFFNIPSYALKSVLEVLAEIEYVDLITKDKRILSVIPNVPRFRDLYQGVGDYFSFNDLNEHEQGTLLILSSLQNKPENKDRLINTSGVGNKLFLRCLDIGEKGNYFRQYRARGKDIIASPFYFADNLDSLVDTSAKIGSSDIDIVLKIIKDNQGWPLSLIQSQLEIGGKKLTKVQKDLLIGFCQEGVLKPPSIDFGNKKSETFIFTPRPGNQRLNAANREIYERAMALVSCVRKGQLLHDKYRIRLPVRILESLKEKGYLNQNSEASSQYRNLVFLKVGMLKEKSNNQWEFHLIKTEENIESLDLAINLLKTGELANLEVDQNAKLALSQDEKYIQSIISSAELREREKISLSNEAKIQFEQLIFEMD
ncbi:hypothetical protein ABEH01_08365 [Pantoea agglomerans]|uniref:hypothetical protein n=1 Tax=Enterobacter agglomerans TaxID=549 RepID=UPI0032095DA1